MAREFLDPVHLRPGAVLPWSVVANDQAERVQACGQDEPAASEIMESGRESESPDGANREDSVARRNDGDVTSFGEAVKRQDCDRPCQHDERENSSMTSPADRHNGANHAESNDQDPRGVEGAERPEIVRTPAPRLGAPAENLILHQAGQTKRYVSRRDVMTELPPRIPRKAASNPR